MDHKCGIILYLQRSNKHLEAQSKQRLEARSNFCLVDEEISCHKVRRFLSSSTFPVYIIAQDTVCGAFMYECLFKVWIFHQVFAILKLDEN